jgi:hypothetical protein
MEIDKARLEYLRQQTGGVYCFERDGVKMIVEFDRVYLDTQADTLQSLKSDPVRFLEKITQLERWGLEEEYLQREMAENRRLIAARAAKARPSVAKSRSGTVYVILSENGFCKIGLTTGNLDNRLKQILTASPFRLKLMHSFPAPDCREAEATLHRKFSEKRRQGEWFDLSRDDIAWLRTIQSWPSGVAA